MYYLKCKNLRTQKYSLFETHLMKISSTKSIIILFWSFCPLYFNKFFIFHQMITFQKLWKMFFISSKKLFSFTRYSNFCIPSSPLLLLVSHCFRAWSKIHLKVYDVINCLNKNLKNILFNILRRKKGITLKLYPLIEY